MTRPTRAVIDRNSILANLATLKGLIPAKTGVMAVVKADAYGHGLIPVARLLAEAGAALGVATVEEALAVKESSITAPILILGPVTPEEMKAAVAADISLTLYDRSLLKPAVDVSRRLGKSIRFHLLVDTGMRRLGFTPPEAIDILSRAEVSPGVKIAGVFSHFPKADEPDDPTTSDQIKAFRDFLASAGSRAWVRHLANSAAVIHFPDSHFDLIRPGLALYGLYPSVSSRKSVDLQPALSLESEVAQIRDFPAGAGIGYGHTFKTARPSKLAVIPVGYGDGVPWRLSNRGAVLIGGNRCPIVGRVCMDLTTVDVTDLAEVKIGDPAVLIGSQGAERITAEDWADWAGTINYEIVCRLSSRVPRSYE